MLGTNDAKAAFKTVADQLADDLGRMTELIRGEGWGGNTPYPSPQVLLIAPIYQPDDTAYGEFFKGADALRPGGRKPDHRGQRPGAQHCPKPCAGKPQKSERNI